MFTPLSIQISVIYPQIFHSPTPPKTTSFLRVIKHCTLSIVNVQRDSNHCTLSDKFHFWFYPPTQKTNCFFQLKLKRMKSMSQCFTSKKPTECISSCALRRGSCQQNTKTFSQCYQKKKYIKKKKNKNNSIKIVCAPPHIFLPTATGCKLIHILYIKYIDRHRPFRIVVAIPHTEPHAYPHRSYTSRLFADHIRAPRTHSVRIPYR